MRRTVLLTSGRGVYSLALARTFHAAGHRVLVADAWPRSLSRYSAAVARYFHVPSPARETDQWVDAVRRIVDAQSVDLVVPVYEEAFYLTQAMRDLSDPPPVFAPDFETLIDLHDKWRFIRTAASLGLPVPRTELLTSRKHLEQTFQQQDGRTKVYKPVYSRFAAHTVVRPQTAEALVGIEPTPQRPWVAQGFLAGRPYATFSVAHRGRITAHSTYGLDFCHDLGPTIVYRRVEQPAVWQWVQSFVGAVGYTGQIGLDFIEDEAGSVAAIECNPRLTGGMYLLKDDPKFADAYFDPNSQRIEASSTRSYAFRFWLLFTLVRHTKSFPGFKEWGRQVLRARSTNPFDFSDLLPRLMGPALIGEFLYKCFREGQTARSMVTRDFEWSEDRATLHSHADAIEVMPRVA